MQGPAGVDAAGTTSGTQLPGRPDWPGPVARFAARAARRRRAGRLPAAPGRQRVAILIRSAYMGAGTQRTVINLASHLARDYDVELISALRRDRESFFPLPDGVRLTTLHDTSAPRALPRRLLRRALGRVPSRLMHPGDATHGSFTPWTDLLLVRKIRSLSPGTVLITTRPALNLLAALVAPDDLVTIGQEHLNITAHDPGLLAAMQRYYPRLDAFTVLTERDREQFHEFLGGTATVAHIPNAVPPLEGGPADPSSKVVVAAGRLVDQKGFDRLVDAFALTSDDHPDWELRVYGAGRNEAALRRQIAERGLEGRARLMGETRTVGTELAKASVYALSSRHEGFPMVILEAMSKGLAVVAFDCPTGPREMLRPGVDGLLVPEGDVGAFAAALAQVMDDEEQRRRLGAAAKEAAQQYDLAAVGRQWEELIGELVTRRSRAASWAEGGPR